MRLDRLDLTRYGMFTDRRIDFGERRAGVPDLHVVYGPNEAGKSTLLAAFLDLLFGIEPRSRFDFLHPYATMRIGGMLEIGGAHCEFARIKRPQNSLLDGNDQAVSSALILGDLGGVDRDAYTTMFSLDDDTLEAGGESILASKGDLGQLLFSASAGLADFSRALGALRGELDEFHKHRSRGGELSKLKARLAELKGERQRIDTLASEYARLVETRDRAGLQYEEAIAARSLVQTRIDQLQRQLTALPRLAALRGIRERLQPLDGLPDVPTGWAEDLPRLQQDEIALATRAQGMETEIRAIETALEAIVVDEAALGLGERLDRLSDLRARYMTAEIDIPERRLDLREADLAISGHLSQMEQDAQTEPRSVLLSASVVGGLRELIEARSGIEAAVKAAENEVSEARRRHGEALARLGEAGGAAAHADGAELPRSMLVPVLSSVRSDDHAARRRLAERSRTERLDALGERMRSLRPWSGDAEELYALSVPQADAMAEWKASEAQAQKAHDRHDSEVKALTAKLLRLEAELEAAGEISGLVGEPEAARIRAVREKAWASHRRALDETSADTFEAALRHDDIVMNVRLGHGAEAARLNQAGRDAAIARADLDRESEARDAAAADLRRIRDEVAAAIGAMAPVLPATLTIAQLETWLARREQALETRAALEVADRDLREAEEDGARARLRLIEALTASGVECLPDAGLDVLVAAAQAAIDRQTEVAALRLDVGERQRELDGRLRELEKAVETDAAWSRSWAALCSGCWLGERSQSPSVAAVGEVLELLGELRPLIERREGLADRIAKMEHDQHDFVAEVEAIGRAIGLDPETLAPLDLAARVRAAVETATADQGARAAAMQRLDDARSRALEIAQAQDAHDRRKAEMMTHFGVGCLAEVDAALRDIAARAELRHQAREAERDILDALGSTSTGEAESQLDDVDRDAVDLELAELKARFDDLDMRTRDLFTEHSKASDRVEAVGGDDAVARLEESRRTTLLEIEEGALGYLRRRLGIAAAEQALRAYRDKHRSSMMGRASQAFRTVSRGAYTALTTQPDKDDEYLVAVGSNTGSKIASALSKGTRFQLYLALRVAGYHEFVQSRRPVPFLADDIMETFDDFRAEEAFRLFTEMAEVGQVVYLTHHRHLCEIAQRVCPGARVHELAMSAG